MRLGRPSSCGAIGHRESPANARDVTFLEGASRVRTANAPRVKASPRNLVIRALRLVERGDIAARLRHHNLDMLRPLTALGISYSLRTDHENDRAPTATQPAYVAGCGHAHYGRSRKNISHASEARGKNLALR